VLLIGVIERRGIENAGELVRMAHAYFSAICIAAAIIFWL
jgi:hypothetical protein